ncbi:MAG: hypothetical protein ACOH2M_22085 [Cypionkella sp.]
MSVAALVTAPLLSVARGPNGVVLGTAEGRIARAPLAVTLTEGEIHIGWVDRDGPAFVIELHPLLKAAVTEIETLLGIKKDAH